MKRLRVSDLEQTPLGGGGSSELMLVVDRSLSMWGQSRALVESLNKLLSALQRQEEGNDCRLSIFLFNDELVLYQACPLSELGLPLPDSMYEALGSTALFDSVKKVLDEYVQPPNMGYASCTLVIATDGEDTCSELLKSEEELQNYIKAYQSLYPNFLHFIYLAQGEEAAAMGERIFSHDPASLSLTQPSMDLSEQIGSVDFMQACAASLKSQHSPEI